MNMPKHNLDGLRLGDVQGRPHVWAEVDNARGVTVATFWDDTVESAVQRARKFIIDNAPLVTVQQDDLVDMADTFVAKGGQI